jgi:hypothetical protein
VKTSLKTAGDSDWSGIVRTESNFSRRCTSNGLSVGAMEKGQEALAVGFGGFLGITVTRRLALGEKHDPSGLDRTASISIGIMGGAAQGSLQANGSISK